LTTLNQLIFNWAANGVDVSHETLTLDTTFSVAIPPHDTSWDVVGAMHYAGTWNAATNTPALASGGGETGRFYRVTTPGATSLDGWNSWMDGDFVLDLGTSWIQCERTALHEQGIIAMLAVRLASDFGLALRPDILEDARSTFASLQSHFLPPADVSFDPTLTRMPSRRWPYSVPADSN
jgi:hypothetical protein